MEKPLQLPFNCQRRVEFSDTDAAGIVHFSSYFRYMEFAESAFFRAIGLPLLSQKDQTVFGFPRVNTQARFKAPLFFEDLVTIELDVESIERSRIHYAFRFLKTVESKPVTVATGSMTVVFVQRSLANKELVAVDIPPAWFDQIQALKTQ